jgi:hypothetical protein
MQNDTMLIGQLVASSMVSLATETARNCLPNASFDQLQRMQTAFENVDLITGLGNAMRLERALCNDSLDRQNWAFYKVPHSDSGHMETAYVNLMTWPWLPANQSAYNRYVQAWIEALKKDSPPLLVSKAAVVEAMPKMNGAESRLALFLSTRASFDGSVRVVAKRQIEANQAVIACAIQRFYLKKHVLPETLSELIPELRLDLPRDVTSGEAFRYVRESETTYKLWSPGWNGVDDGGVLPAKRSDLESGDWVWQGRVK